jgi:hypothetical protein
MSFGRFVWLLQKKELWFAIADKLDDAWEFWTSSQQVPKYLELWKKDRAAGNQTRYETEDEAREGVRRAIIRTRRTTFVNCWTRREVESYGMWRDYCLSREGVAIRTTVGRLYDSLQAPVEVVPVSYRADPSDIGLLDLLLAAQKRPPFESEQEVRAVLPLSPYLNADAPPAGLGVPWVPADHVDRIRVHPDATPEFADTVRRTVDAFAPVLTALVEVSEMTLDPETSFKA